MEEKTYTRIYIDDMPYIMSFLLICLFLQQFTGNDSLFYFLIIVLVGQILINYAILLDSINQVIK